MKQLLFLFLSVGPVAFAQSNTFPSSGYAGIGTTSPQLPFEIAGLGQIIRNTNLNSYSTLRLYNDQNNVMRALEIDYSGSEYPSSLLPGGPSGESASIVTTGAYPLVLGTSNSARLTILGNGNVGIGTPTPSELFHVKSSLRYPRISVQSTHANGAPGFDIRDASGNPKFTWHYDIAGGFMGFYQAGNKMVITDNGNVGIGITSPQRKLDINGGSGYAIGTLTSSRYVIEVRNTGDTDGGWWLVNDPNGSFALHENSVGDQLTIKPGGNVGIGTKTPDQRLTVNGTIHSKEVKVDLSIPAPDYVFEKEYKLPSLEEVKTYIDQNKHLPDVPSAREMEMNGVQLCEMNLILLKKIEELTLYTIYQNQRNEALTKLVQDLQTDMQIIKAEK